MLWHHCQQRAACGDHRRGESVGSPRLCVTLFGAFRIRTVGYYAVPIGDRLLHIAHDQFENDSEGSTVSAGGRNLVVWW